MLEVIGILVGLSVLLSLDAQVNSRHMRKKIDRLWEAALESIEPERQNELENERNDESWSWDGGDTLTPERPSHRRERENRIREIPE